MKKIDFKTRAQWSYFKSAIFGLAIGMLIAPGISDLIRGYENAAPVESTSVKDKVRDMADSVMDYFVPGQKVKVLINGNVAAIAKSRSEAEEAYKQARLSYNSDGIKPLWIDVSYEDVDRENDKDVALLKEMKPLKGQELTDSIMAAFDHNSDSEKKLAYTMRIDDYIVTLEKFEDVVSVLERAQSVYDTEDEFRVGLKQPESKNVAIYEVEINEKVDDIERNVPDKIENTEETTDGTDKEASSTTESAIGGTSEESSSQTEETIEGTGEQDSTKTGAMIEIPAYVRTALTEGEPETGEVSNTGETDSNDAEADTEGDNSDASENTDGEADSDSSDSDEDTADELKVDENDPEVVSAEAKLGAEDGIKYVGFSDRIYVAETYVNKSEIKSGETVYNEVTTPVEEAGVYVVEPGDCLSIIAEKVGMTEDKIKELNEGIEDDSDIYYDDRLNILVPTPPVEIMMEKQETYTEKYYADVEYQDDGSMYIGETSVIQEGSPGIHTVTDLVTYKGNLESDRKHIDEVVETAAVAEVVLRGTKSKPTYMYPVTNWNITSNFGYRWGRLHAGTDVGVPQGTTVRASRGGQVVTAGWVGGYGNCVIIDHGDGVSTRYGHLSQVLVSVGQYVDQGDQIALSGNTGRSTGPHLHFEIRINGEAVDPMPYLQ
ncbi:MAG: peptidoglycan DD-metalloendopeptidase family protein [Lachnospiraceae bacterium]|nr:peptidoglycan DD-metalloendopeptidase family protein [Lachnospiraceae bacterium]